MKVILLQNVTKVGKKGDVIEVSDGYAANALFPGKKAIPATQKNLESLQRKVASDRATKELEQGLLEAAIKALPNTTLTITMKANEKGHLFSKVDAGVIVAALEKYRISISPKNVVLKDPIKQLGDYGVVIQEGETEVHIPLSIIAE